MSKRRNHISSNKPSSKISWQKFLLMLNSSWGRATSIIAIFVAGVSAGRFYEEAKQAQSHIEYIQQREDYWRSQLREMQLERDGLINQIYSLREQNLQLLQSKEDSIPSLKNPSSYEQ